METADGVVETADGAVERADATAETATIDTGEAAKTTVALETGEVEAKKDCCYEESVALASNLEARCPPLAIQRFVS